MKIYLREVIESMRFGNHISISIFEGDINEDKKYWKSCKANVRYFELKEVKIK